MTKQEPTLLPCRSFSMIAQETPGRPALPAIRDDAISASRLARDQAPSGQSRISGASIPHSRTVTGG